MKQETIQHKKAFKYYCMGLNSKEIGKLLDVSYRTIQNYMSSENWKQKRTPKGLPLQVYKMHAKGKSYEGIAKELGVSRSTVYNALKKYRLQLK